MTRRWAAGAFGLIACTAVWAQDPAWTAADRPYEDAGKQDLAHGNADKAAADFDADLRVNPFDPVALNNLAVVESERGHNERAEELLERAVQLAPDNAAIAANLARVHEYLSADTLQPGERHQVHALPLSQANVPPPPPELWGRIGVGAGSPVPPPPAPPVHRRSAGGAAVAHPVPAPAAAGSTGDASTTYYNGCSGHGFTMSPAEAYRCRQAPALPIDH